MLLKERGTTAQAINVSTIPPAINSLWGTYRGNRWSCILGKFRNSGFQMAPGTSKIDWFVRCRITPEDRQDRLLVSSSSGWSQVEEVPSYLFGRRRAEEWLVQLLKPSWLKKVTQDQPLRWIYCTSCISLANWRRFSRKRSEGLDCIDGNVGLGRKNWM